MRNISFALTTQQFKDRTKDVTRRLGWNNLQVGTVLMAVEKCQGLKKGEKIKQLGKIKVTGVRRTILFSINQSELIREGLPGMTPEEFIKMFCKSHKGCKPDTIVTRIQYEYL